MAFYHYSQNNSGGRFIYDDKLTHHVVIEAPNAATADALLIGMGGYFNGVDEGRDCSCCGDRWSEASDRHDAYQFPQVHGQKLDDKWQPQHGRFLPKGTPEARVHYLDGRVESYGE